VATPAPQYQDADLKLRSARPEDALCLSVLAMQVFLDTYATQGIRPQLAREVMSSCSESSFVRAISEDAGRLDVAEIRGHLVGFSQVSFNARHGLAPPGNQAELLRLYVQEPFTGAKLGTRLLGVAERVVQERGASVLWLTPWAYNARALAFYRRRGYTDFGLTHFTFEGESHENRVYAKRLPDAA